MSVLAHPVGRIFGDLCPGGIQTVFRAGVDAVERLAGVDHVAEAGEEIEARPLVDDERRAKTESSVIVALCDKLG